MISQVGRTVVAVCGRRGAKLGIDSQMSSVEMGEEVDVSTLDISFCPSRERAKKKNGTDSSLDDCSEFADHTRYPLLWNAILNWCTSNILGAWCVYNYTI